MIITFKEIIIPALITLIIYLIVLIIDYLKSKGE